MCHIANRLKWGFLFGIDHWKYHSKHLDRRGMWAANIALIFGMVLEANSRVLFFDNLSHCSFLFKFLFPSENMDVDKGDQNPFHK